MLDNVQINIAGGLNFTLPNMARVRQKFEKHGLPDVSAAVTDQVARDEVAATIQPGARIAIGVGSRGVANIEEAVRALVAAIKAKGGDPFVFPAMGSHGGGTADAQAGLLAGYGVTEEAVGAPIRATMETVVVDTMEDGVPLHVDRLANEADGIVLVNRVKPHTSFRGAIESGVIKMMTIGMGKINGASALHGGYLMEEFGEVLSRAAEKIMAKTPFLFGLGMVEDAFDDTAIIEAMTGPRLIERETDLQAKAKALMARIYFDDIDVLVIDEIGKEISGSGCDPNITGRNMRGVSGFELPRVKRIVILDVTDKTKGNATGFSSADVITQRMLSRIDFSVTYANVIASTYLEGGKVPIPMQTEEDAVRLAVKSLNGIKPEDARIVRIRNTLDLSEIAVSEPMLAEVRADDRMEVLEDPRAMAYDTAA